MIDFKNRVIVTLAVLLGLLLGVLMVAGCSRDGSSGESSFASEPVVPADLDLSAPEPAVRSYLDWVSFSYRMANSEIATPTMGPWEAVRIDAYIELNRQNGEGIEQRLLDFSVRSTSEEATATILAASERWWFRYFSLDTLRYTAEPSEASYETTYTVVREGDVWVVESVDATPLDPLD